MVSDGRAVLAGHGETVAGSVLTMDRAVALTVEVARVTLLGALRAASLHPAMALGEAQKGHLSPGADADIVVLGPDLSVLATIIGGRLAHDATGWLGAVVPAPGEQRGTTVAEAQVPAP